MCGPVTDLSREVPTSAGDATGIRSDLVQQRDFGATTALRFARMGPYLTD
jgi:hypothetical protein